MKTYLISLLLLLNGALFAQDLTALLEQSIAENHFAGLSAGYLIGDEEAVIAAAGYRDLDQQLLFDNNTSCRIASITKPMTAVAILQLWERGLIDLDASVQTYVPDYPTHDQGTITIRHLLQHTSGIGAYENRESENKTFYPTMAAAAEVFQDRPLLHAPGERESYSSYGYVVLGLVIEAVSGQSYEAYLQEHIFTPAGMTRSGIERAGATYENKSQFYYRNRRGKIKDSTPNDLSNRLPGGGVYSTAGDLLRFGQALMNGSLINDTTFAMMQEHPNVPYEGNPYAMGIFLYGDNPLWGNLIGHGGEQTGVSAQLMLLTDHQASVIVLSNTALSARFAGPLSVEILKLVHQKIQAENR